MLAGYFPFYNLDAQDSGPNQYGIPLNTIVPGPGISLDSYSFDFNGSLDYPTQEVYQGYDYSQSAFLGPNFESCIPEPATMIVWSLLGAASWLGMRVWRQGRRVGRQPWSDGNRQAIHEIIARGVHR